MPNNWPYQPYHWLNWPYNKSELKSVITFINEYQYRHFEGPSCEEKTAEYFPGWNGCGILTCENDRLVINGDDYYWKNIKIDPSQDINASGQHNTVVVGDGNQVATGPNNSLVMNNNGGSVALQTGSGSSVTQQTGNGNSVTQQNTNITIAFGAGTFFGIILNFLLKYLYDIYREWHSKRLPKRNSKK